MRWKKILVKGHFFLVNLSEQWKHQNNVRNLLTLNNKGH